MAHRDDKRANNFLQERGLSIEKDVLVLFCAFSLNNKNTLYVSVAGTVPLHPESNNSKPFCSENNHTSKIILEI